MPSATLQSVILHHHSACRPTCIKDPAGNSNPSFLPDASHVLLAPAQATRSLDSPQLASSYCRAVTALLQGTVAGLRRGGDPGGRSQRFLDFREVEGGWGGAAERHCRWAQEGGRLQVGAQMISWFWGGSEGAG